VLCNTVQQLCLFVITNGGWEMHAHTLTSLLNLCIPSLFGQMVSKGLTQAEYWCSESMLRPLVDEPVAAEVLSMTYGPTWRLYNTGWQPAALNHHTHSPLITTEITATTANRNTETAQQDNASLTQTTAIAGLSEWQPKSKVTNTCPKLTHCCVLFFHKHKQCCHKMTCINVSG